MLVLIFYGFGQFCKHCVFESCCNKKYVFFKVKFLTLYHAIHGLNKFQDYFYAENLLTDKSKQYLKEIFSSKYLKRIKNQSAFRDILVHYSLNGSFGRKKLENTNIQLDIEFYGLVEHFFKGISYDELEVLVDNELSRIAVIFEEWRGWK